MGGRIQRSSTRLGWGWLVGGVVSKGGGGGGGGGREREG